MHDAAAGKVVEAVDPEPPEGVPRPVGQDGVDEARDHDGVDDVGHEVAALGQGAGDQRGRRGGEHKVEEPLGQLVRWKERKRNSGTMLKNKR